MTVGGARTAPARWPESIAKPCHLLVDQIETTQMLRDHTTLVRRLQDALDRSSSMATKAWWEGYLKGVIPFRGVGIPQIRAVLADWRAEQDVASWPPLDQFSLALRLFDEPLAEDKIAGTLYLQEYLCGELPWRVAVPQYGSLFERGLIADWNTCDWFCVRVLGPTIALNGRLCAATIARWRSSPTLWKARASVVSLVPVIDNPDYHQLALRSAAVLIRRQERFAKTAVGWILRDLSKYDEELVRVFLDGNLVHFSTESLRNALKYTPLATRQEYLRHLRAVR
jgi:3-methyladenine DNA glycosylase AlkD